ncbi:MAG: hypothetical protein AAGH87_10230 [Pseudomonadota bacterium]
MLFRRISAHVKEQNWTAVALDFAIVVVGVFVGIQVANFNDARREAETRAALRLELAEDLKADLAEIEGHISFSAYRFAAAEALVGRVTGWQLPDAFPAEFGTTVPLARPGQAWPEEAADALFFSQRYTTFDVERRVYDTLVATGELDITDDRQLVEDLRAYYLFAQNWRNTEDTTFRNTHDRLRARFKENGLTFYEQVSWEALDGLVAEDLELTGLLKSTAYDASIQVATMEDFQDIVSDLLARLQAE